MKSTTNNRTSQVRGGNRAALESAIKGMKLNNNALGVLLLIADMFDEIESGKNLYMVLGSTQSGSAFSLAVKGDISPAPMYAASLEDLGVLSLDLL